MPNTSPIKEGEFFNADESFTQKLPSEEDFELKETIDVLQATHRFGQESDRLEQKYASVSVKLNTQLVEERHETY